MSEMTEVERLDKEIAHLQESTDAAKKLAVPVVAVLDPIEADAVINLRRFKKSILLAKL